MGRQSIFIAVHNAWNKEGQPYENWIQKVNEHVSNVYEKQNIKQELITAKRIEIVFNNIRNTTDNLNAHLSSHKSQIGGVEDASDDALVSAISDYLLSEDKNDLVRIFNNAFGRKFEELWRLLDSGHQQGQGFDDISEGVIASIFIKWIEKIVQDTGKEVNKDTGLTLSKEEIKNLAEIFITGGNTTKVSAPLKQISEKIKGSMYFVEQKLSKQYGVKVKDKKTKTKKAAVGSMGNSIEQKVDLDFGQIVASQDPEIRDKIESELSKIVGELSQATFTVKNYQYAYNTYQKDSSGKTQLYTKDQAIAEGGDFWNAKKAKDGTQLFKKIIDTESEISSVHFGSSLTRNTIIGPASKIFTENKTITVGRLGKDQKGEETFNIPVSFYLRGLGVLYGYIKGIGASTITETWRKMQIIYEISGFGQAKTANYLIMNFSGSGKNGFIRVLPTKYVILNEINKIDAKNARLGGVSISSDVLAEME